MGGFWSSNGDDAYGRALTAAESGIGKLSGENKKKFDQLLTEQSARGNRARQLRDG